MNDYKLNMVSEKVGNPGMDMEIWKGFKDKWTGLAAKGHKLKIDFQLISDPKDSKKILAIDVIQHVDGKPITETVQRQAGEGYAPLGIAELSNQELEAMHKQMMQQLREQSNLRDISVTVTMKLTSSTSGELQGYLEVPDAPVQSSLQLNYQHYYVLNALRDKMLEQTGKGWNQVKTVYYAGNLEFDFKYP